MQLLELKKIFLQISAIVSVLICPGCDDGHPTVMESRQILSPDGNWVVTIEKVDNKLGFGLGAIYEEVHLTKPKEDVGAHGDPGSSVVYYIESDYKKDKTIDVEWTAINKIRITCNPSCPPVGPSNKLKQLNSIRGISVEYADYSK
jgi:hypothetical protein